MPGGNATVDIIVLKQGMPAFGRAERNARLIAFFQQ